MPQTVNVNFRMDSDLKKSMEQTCSAMGMSMTTAFTIFAKTVAREKRIPFEVTADPFYSRGNMEHLADVAERIRNRTAELAEHELVEAD